MSTSIARRVGMSWIVIAAVIVIGCKKEDHPAPGPTAPPPANPAPVPRAGAGVTGTGSGVAVTSTPQPRGGFGTAPPAIPGATLPVVDLSTANPLVSAAELTRDAQSKLSQVTQYTTDQKYDQADATLRQLEAAKSALPAAIQNQVASARRRLSAARSGATQPATNPAGGLNKDEQLNK
jgi:hypothetical protein